MMNPVSRTIALLVISSAFISFVISCAKPSGKVATGDSAAKSAAASAKTAKTTETKETTKPTTAPTPADASTAGASTGPALKQLAELPANCTEAYRALVNLRRQIPLVFQDLTRTHTEIDTDVKKAIATAEEFLKSCEECDKSAWVKANLARDLSTRYKRYLTETEAVVKKQLSPDGANLTADQKAAVKTRVRDMSGDYLERIDRLISEALAVSAPKSEVHCNCLGVLADKDFTFTRKFADFRDTAARYIANGCEKMIPTGQDYHYSIGMSFVVQGLYQEAQNHFEAVLEKRSDQPEYVLYNIGLWEALYALGSLEEGEELLLRMRGEYGQKLEDTTLSRVLRTQYEQWYYISDFWIPFIRYALGNADAALLGFQSYIDRASQLQNSLKLIDKEISPVIRIYRDFRARDTVHFLENLQGQTAPVDLTDGIEWVANGSLSIPSSAGKVLAVLFRQPQNTRAVTYLRQLDNLLSDYPDDLAVATLGFIPKGVRSAGRQARVENMRNEIASLGISYPAGFDVTDNSKNFRNLSAVVGTASVIIFDEHGRPAWYHVDPTENDVNLLDRVIARMIKLKKERAGK